MDAPGPIARELTDDHARLGALFARSIATPAAIDREAYDAFRAGLLRHIALEEKILLRAAREANGGTPLRAAARLRVEHGAIAALLVPSPTHALAAELRLLLDPHERLEEDPGGVYEECERLLAARAAEIVAAFRAYPAVKVAAYFDGPRVVRTAAAALALVGQGAQPADPSTP